MIAVSPWADLDARPWDFQAEECALRANIERFNSRRYEKTHNNPDFLPVDNCLQSVLGQRVDLPEDFQMNYDLWLEREVFSKPISWEELLQWESTTVNITMVLTRKENREITNVLSLIQKAFCYLFCTDWRSQLSLTLIHLHIGPVWFLPFDQGSNQMLFVVNLAYV